MQLQAELHRLEEAGCEALRSVDVFERLGAVEDLKICRGFLRKIEEGVGELPRLKRYRVSCSPLPHVQGGTLNPNDGIIYTVANSSE